MKFTVVRSSAGSGKTYTLVKHYLLMLFGSSDLRYYRHVLAITFTNKATNEMKDRILDALNGLALKSNKYNHLLTELATILELSEVDVSLKSSKILSYLIHDYAEFSVSTIDRFAYKIIRSFAFELNIPGNMEIELNRDKILQKSIDSLFENMAENKSLIDLLIEFAEHKFITDKSINIENELFEMASEVLNARSEPYLLALQNVQIKNFREVKTKLYLAVNEIQKSLSQEAKNILKFLESYGLDSGQMAGGKYGLYGYVSLFCQEEFELKQPYAKLLKSIDSNEWKASKVNKDVASVIDGISNELTQKATDFITLVHKNWKHFHFCKLMMVRLHSLALVNEIHLEIQRFKTDNGIAQLDDFNNMIGKLIDNNPVPYIYERIGEKYHHFLIDEFQDTSQIQWYNLLPLIENGLAEGFNSMVVGDVKQAIYRWRGGDVTQMSRLPKLNFPGRPVELVAERQRIIESNMESTPLPSNFRSTEVVVSFVNHFFARIAELFPDVTSEVYNDPPQKVINNKIEGSVEIKFLKGEDEIEKLEEILSAISRFQESGYGFGDIAILCRKKNQCSMVADFLMSHSIPVISSESLKISSSKEVQFLIHWITYFVEEDNTSAQFALLEYLVECEINASFTNDVLLKQWIAGRRLKVILQEFYPELNVRDLPNMGLQEFCTNLAYRFLGEKSSDPFVLNFIDQVSKFETKWGNDGLEFLAWWEEKGLTLDVEMPQTTNSVQIMTIHKAKGLEFNIVLAPFMHDPIKPSESHFWMDTINEDKKIMPVAWLPATSILEETAYGDYYQEEMKKSFIDTLNLMYVVMTRAAHHLFMLSKMPANMENDKTEENILWRCFDLSEYQGSSENGHFSKGKLSSRYSSTLNEFHSMSYKKAENVNWKSKIQLKYRIDHIGLSESKMSPADYGNLIHNILSQVEDIIELPLILKNFQTTGLISAEQVEIIEKNISVTINNSAVKPYFNNLNGEVFNEREVLSSKGQVFRPDRMIISNEEITLIDYKTGLPDQLHDEQLLTYINVLKDIEEKPVNAYLIYFASGEVRKVA